MSTNEYIIAAAAEKAVSLTLEQIAYAERTLESAINAHQKRIDAWVAAKMDIDPDAADLKIPVKAKQAIRDALKNA